MYVLNDLTKMHLIANHDVTGFYCLKNRVAVCKNILLNVMSIFRIYLLCRADKGMEMGEWSYTIGKSLNWYKFWKLYLGILPQESSLQKYTHLS